MPIYTVTYCTMDETLGANPFWHTCLLLSCFDEHSKKLEVVESWGFYGLPTTNQESLLRTLKIKVGMDVDLYGNHGMLRHEEMRYLELGVGLHGATFEVAEENFRVLQDKCKMMADRQQQAIDDAVKSFNLKGKPQAHTRIYPYEHLSKHILALEEAAAKEQNRSPRLKKFALSFFEPHTCKMVVLDLLEGVLTPSQVNRVRGFHHAVSRFSGKMENILLHSSGPLRQHAKRSGETVYYHDGADAGVKLHWTLPPQEIETMSGEVKDLFKVHDEHCDGVKKVVRKLQQLEWLFRNAMFEQKNFDRRDRLVNLIREHYEVFAVVEPKTPRLETSRWVNTALWLLSMPGDDDEKAIMDHLAQAKYFINALYMAMDNPKSSEDEDNAKEDDIDLVVLAGCLDPDKQRELCKIIGRSYLAPDCDNERQMGLAV